MIASGQGHLCGDGHPQHGGARHRDPAFIQVYAVKTIEVVFDFTAECFEAPRMHVKRMAIVERLFRRLTNKGRRDYVPFAKPERYDIRVTQARKGNGSNTVLFQCGNVRSYCFYSATFGVFQMSRAIFQ